MAGSQLRAASGATYLLLTLLLEDELRLETLARLEEGGALLALVEEEAHYSDDVDAERQQHEGPQLRAGSGGALERTRGESRN